MLIRASSLSGLALDASMIILEPVNLSKWVLKADRFQITTNKNKARTMSLIVRKYFMKMIANLCIRDWRYRYKMLLTKSFWQNTWLWLVGTLSLDNHGQTWPFSFSNSGPRPSPPSAAYMRQWFMWALVRIMAWRLFGAKPLSKPMLGY